MSTKPLTTTEGLFSTTSNILHPFREFGVITNKTPAKTRTFSTETVIITNIGSSYNLYNASALKQIFAGPNLPEKINCLELGKHHVFVGVGSAVLVLKRSRIVRRIEMGEDRPEGSIVQNVLCMGDYLVCVIRHPSQPDILRIRKNIPQRSQNKNTTKPNNSHSNEDIITAIVLAGSDEQITCLLHPTTYVNKILVCTSRGNVHLVNIHSKKVVYSFKFDSEIVSCSQSGVLDVVCFGLANRQILVHNIRTDKQIHSFQNSKAQGAPISISFRTDEHARLAVGCSNGDVVIWNLENARLSTTIQGAHSQSVTTCEFLPAQPVLLTTSPENSIKLWIFDQTDGSARLLRFRDGHSIPPRIVQYYGNDGLQLLTAGPSGSAPLRLTSTVKQSRNCSFSMNNNHNHHVTNITTHHRLHKHPPNCISFSVSREHQWANIVTTHKNESVALLWSYDKKKIGEKVLIPPENSKAALGGGVMSSISEQKNVVTVAVVSHCGNFAFLGTKNGLIHKFNLQSAIYRCTTSRENSHTNEVSGICVDMWGRFVGSCSFDGSVRFWKTQTLESDGVVDLETPLSVLVDHSKSGLFAVAGDDFGTYVIDFVSRRIVRKFASRHTDAILAQAFSHDGRLLAVCSADGTMTIWKIPTATLADWVRFEKVATAVSFSPQGDMIATCHANSLGVSLWINKLLYASSMNDSPPEKPVSLVVPKITKVIEEDDGSDSETDWMKGNENDANNSESDNDRFGDHSDNSAESDNENDNKFKSAEATKKTAGDEEDDGVDADHDDDLDRKRRFEGLVTFSGLPRAHWHSLAHYDTIRKRNRPVEPPKQPERAPFFLQTILPQQSDAKGVDFFLGATNSLSDNTTPAAATTTPEEQSRIKRAKTAQQDQPKTPLEKLLIAGDDTATIHHLAHLTPSATHLQLQLLERSRSVVEFLRFVLRQLQTRERLEFVHSLLCVFVQCHGESLLSGDKDEEISGAIACVAKEAERIWGQLHALVDSNLCLVQFFSKVQA